MPGGVEGVQSRLAQPQRIAVVEWRIDLGSLRRRHSDPSRLGIERVAEDGVVLVHIHWCAGDLFKLLSATDVIDMGVGDNDHDHAEVMAGEDEQDLVDFIAGIDDDGLAGGFVAEDGAVALE